MSLLPILNKVLEKALNHRFEEFFIKNNIIDNSQFGFKSNCGTTNALIELSNDIIDSIDQNKFVAAIFLDIENAFGSVSHEILLNKLKQLGVREDALKRSKSYFSDRYQAVKIGNFISSYNKVKQGVGQGSIESTLHFNVLFDDFKRLPLPAKSQRYADDNCLWFEFETENELISTTRKIMDIVNDFYSINGLKVNDDKNALVIFHKSWVEENFCDKIIMNDKSVLNRVKGHKYLGVYFDENINFKPHFTNLCNKLRSVVALLSHLKHMLPSAALLQVYFTQFHSHLYFATQLWGHVPEGDAYRISCKHSKIEHLNKFSTSPLKPQLMICSQNSLQKYCPLEE